MKYNPEFFEKKGFIYLREYEGEFYLPERVKLPSGKILTKKELSDYFKDTPLEFGNSEHIEMLNALNYIELVNSDLFTIAKDRLDYPDLDVNEFKLYKKRKSNF